MTKDELSKLTVREVIEMPEFADELRAQIVLEEDSHTKALEKGRLKRTTLDSLRDRKVFDVPHLKAAFMAILDKSLVGYSSMERQYIHSLGMVTFARVMVKLQKMCGDDGKETIV